MFPPIVRWFQADRNSPTRLPVNLFQFRNDIELLDLGVVTNLKHIGLAADLAILHVALRAPGGFVNGRFVPLAATGALKTCFHQDDCRTRLYNVDSSSPGVLDAFTS
jgi:hypothetical protein